MGIINCYQREDFSLVEKAVETLKKPKLLHFAQASLYDGNTSGDTNFRFGGV